MSPWKVVDGISGPFDLASHLRKSRGAVITAPGVVRGNTWPLFQWIAEIHIEGTGKAARFVLCASFKIPVAKLFRPLGLLVFLLRRDVRVLWQWPLTIPLF
jgi:hypothetical protein